MRKRRFWLAVGCAACVAVCAAAQQMRVESAVLRPAGPYAVGDRIELRVLIHTPEGVRPEAVAPSDSSAASYGPPAVARLGSGEWEAVVPFQIFRVGQYSLDSFWISADGQRVEINPGTVEIRSIRSGEDADILKDPKPPAELPRPWSHAVYWTLGLLLAGSAVFWAARRRRVKEEPAPPPPPPESPEERLERELSHLEARLKEGNDPPGSVYADAADAVRVYLAQRTSVPAPRLASSSTLAQLDAVLTKSARADLSTMLREADEVKFAASSPDAEAERAGIEAARRVSARLSPDA
ncbi:MAG: hypothetical protein OXT69_14835 [Candidatus Poribacteria bacterium]|nr:hypothetical protein [Candidatus Poribacteria bacterium]